jgi:serine/threonine-protein kinase
MAEVHSDDWRLYSTRLDEALGLEETQREVWLQTLAQQNAALAARLRAALAVSRRDGYDEFLAGPSPVLPAAMTAGTLIGRSVGPYVIDAEIGRGGMGSVWRAHRADGRFEGNAAIKFVHAAWIGRSGEERFRTEGTLLGRLDHPNIARLIDAGVLDGAQPYLILEYVEGEAIDVHCQHHSLDTAGRLHLFLAVLDAVAHAHSHLIVHRDLKPSNVFVTSDGTVKLLDFGIARLLEADTGIAAATQSSASALTPQYAAPEQLLGKGITTATDVYALGLLLYVLLTGRHPVPAGSRSNAELVRAIVTEVPVQASSVAGLATIPSRMLSGDLDNILHRALKKEPSERYATVGAFSEDLQRYLSHQPVQARPDTVSYRMGKFVRRHRGGVAAALLCVVAIFGGLAGTMWQARRAEQQALQAQRERDHALRELTYTEAANEFVNFLLGHGTGKPMTNAQLLGQAEQLVEKQFARDAELRARLQLMIGNSYSLASELKLAQAVLERARASAALADNVAISAMIDCTLADVRTDDGDFSKAASLFETAIARLHAAPDPDAHALATCLAMRGQMEAMRSDGKAALASGQEALRWLGTPRPGQRTLAADAHTTLAEGYSRLGQLAPAIREYEAALQDMTLMGRENTTDASITFNNLAEKYTRAGQLPQAAEAHRRSFEIARDIEGPDNANPVSEASYASSLTDNGRGSEALPLFVHALAASSRRGQKLWTAYVQALSVPTLCQAHQLTECAQAISSARATLKKILPEGHGIFGVLEVDDGRLWMARNACAQARAHLRAAVAIFDATAEPRPSHTIALTMLARCDQQLGDGTAALHDADLALTAAEALHSGYTHTAWIGAALLARADVLYAQGNATAARPVLLEAQAHLEDAAGPTAPDTLAARALRLRIDAPTAVGSR